MKRETRYLNTDLDLVAPVDLAPLADALAQRGLLVFHVLQHEDVSWSTRFETEEPFLEPDPNIAAMLTAIGSLDEPYRSLWDACTIREFDIGYQCGDEPSTTIRQQLTTETLTGIAAAGATVLVTLYPMEETDYSEAAVEILMKDESIQSHIGKDIGYHYHQKDLPSLKEGLAEVKVTLYGKKGSLDVHCLMELNNQEE